MLFKPKNGLLFLDVNFFTQKISKIADEHNNKEVPFIIDCQTFNKVDYTAMKVCKNMIFLVFLSI